MVGDLRSHRRRNPQPPLRSTGNRNHPDLSCPGHGVAHARSPPSGDSEARGLTAGALPSVRVGRQRSSGRYGRAASSTLANKAWSSAAPSRRTVAPRRVRRIGQDSVVTVPTSRADRRRQRRAAVETLFGQNADAALDILELTEFAWHDCYGEVTPPDSVIDDILACARGQLVDLARACRLAVEDYRDLRIWADDLRAK